MLFRSRLPLGAVLMMLVLLSSRTSLQARDHPPGTRSTMDVDVRYEPLGGRSLADLKLSALRESPRLASARARVAQAEADVRELRLYPNPVLQVEGEELPADWSTGPGLLMTTINQSIVTGGKRRYRVRSARAAVNRAVREYEQEALELTRDITKAYVDILAARRQLQVAHCLAQLARRFRDVVRVRVQEGVTRPIESERAIVVAGQAAADIRKAEAEQRIAAQALATLLGRPAIDGAAVTGHLDRHLGLPALADLKRRAMERSPTLGIPAAEVAGALADLDLARAQRIPDIEVGLSVQHQSDPDRSHDLRGFQLNVPLPVFNRGQAAADRARATAAGARARALLAGQVLINRLVAAYETALRAHDQRELYLDQVLPAARTAVDLAAEGYDAGKFTYLEVLDGQRALAGANRDYVDALADYHKARADLEEIVAGALPEPPEHQADEHAPAGAHVSVEGE